MIRSIATIMISDLYTPDILGSFDSMISYEDPFKNITWWLLRKTIFEMIYVITIRCQFYMKVLWLLWNVFLKEYFYDKKVLNNFQKSLICFIL